MFEILWLIIRCGWLIIRDTPKIKRYARHPERYPLEVRYNAVRKVIKYILDRWKTEWHLINEEQYLNYKGKRVIVVNHIDTMDPLYIIALSEKPFMVVAKKEVEKYPFIGTYLKAMGGVFLDRENLMNQVRTLNTAMKMAQDPNGPDVLIFPEGTRNKKVGSHCAEFKAGTFKIAMKSGVPIFPVAVYGTFRSLTTKLTLSKYPINIHFFDPINPEEYTKSNSFDLAKKSYDLIDNEVMRFKKLDLEQLKDAKGSKKSKARAIAPDLVEE